MSSEPHFPLAPRFPSPQHTAPWTEMEVLLCRVALGWNQRSHSSLCSWGQAGGTTWMVTLASLSRGNLGESGAQSCGECLVPILAK